MENPSSVLDAHYDLAPTSPVSSTRSSTPASFYADFAGSTPYSYDFPRSPTPYRPASPNNDRATTSRVRLSSSPPPARANPDFINYSIPDIALQLARDLDAERAAAATDDRMSDNSSLSDEDFFSNAADYSPPRFTSQPSSPNTQDLRAGSNSENAERGDSTSPAPQYNFPAVNFIATAVPRFVSPHAPARTSPLTATPITAADLRQSSARAQLPHPFTPVRIRHSEHCCDPCRERLEAVDHRYTELQRLVFNLSEFTRFRLNHLDGLITDTLEGQEHVHDDLRYYGHILEHVLSEVRELAGRPPIELHPPPRRD